MISVKINGVNVEVEKGTSILDAAKKLNIIYLHYVICIWWMEKQEIARELVGYVLLK